MSRWSALFAEPLGRRDAGVPDVVHQLYGHLGLVEDGGQVDAVATPKLHLRAADGGAENVHRGQEVIAHLVDAATYRLEHAQNDVRRLVAPGITIALDRVADRVNTPAKTLFGANTASITSGRSAYFTPAAAVANVTPSMTGRSGNRAGARGETVISANQHY